MKRITAFISVLAVLAVLGFTACQRQEGQQQPGQQPGQEKTAPTTTPATPGGK